MTLTRSESLVATNGVVHSVIVVAERTEILAVAACIELALDKAELVTGVGDQSHHGRQHVELIRVKSGPVEGHVPLVVHAQPRFHQLAHLPPVADAAVVADVEAVSKPGMGIDEGVVLSTFLLLTVAIICVVMANQLYTA